MYKDFRPWTKEEEKQAEIYRKELSIGNLNNEQIEEIVDTLIWDDYEDSLNDSEQKFEISDEEMDKFIKNMKPVKLTFLSKRDKMEIESKKRAEYLKRQKYEMLDKMPPEERLEYSIKESQDALEFAKQYDINIYKIDDK